VGFVYLAGLAVSLTGMVVLDRRFVRRASIVFVVGLALFLVWDVIGIAAGVFFRGETQFLTGLQLAPELPVEEPVFLALLIYTGMNVFGALSRRAGTAVEA
jgi:lycopene cyclase domain-containing protein